MANRSYLTCAREKHTYPSFQESDFDPGNQTVACGTGIVPVLWLAMFRPDDIMVEEFVAPGANGAEGIVARQPAPVVLRNEVADRLQQAIPLLDGALPDHVSLLEYAESLRDAIATVDAAFPYITIEMEEIAVLWEKEQYYQELQEVMAFFSGGEDQETADALVEMFGQRALPSIKNFMEEEVDEEDYETIDMLIGSSWERVVPWEPEL